MDAREYRGIRSSYFPERRPLASGAPETKPKPIRRFYGNLKPLKTI